MCGSFRTTTPSEQLPIANMTNANSTADGHCVVPGEAPLCAAPDPQPRRPSFALPPLACDCHAHICGPRSRYAYFPERIYTPPEALLSDYRRMLDTLGVERAVLVQPSVYGADNTALLDALATDPGRLRGVAVVEPDISRVELERLHRAGVRGVRCNIVDVKEGKGRLPLEALRALADKIRPHGWHIELLLHVDEFPDIDRALAEFPVDVVLGHLGYMRAGGTNAGVDAPGFRALLRLLATGRAWVKLTGPYRISVASGLPYADVTPLARALVDVAPDRIVWGTDWPHVMVKTPMPNDGALCDLLADWVPDAGRRRAVLVDNSARLYGF
jgi:2-pyrone-4,6-dicarboxylate lactonase